MEKLCEKDDKELVHLARTGDSVAEEFLLKKYIPLVNKEIRFLYIVGAEDKDLLQEGMIGLMKAIRNYDEEGEASFMTFASLCIRRQTRTAITASNRKKHAPLNEYTSIYQESEEDGNDSMLINAIENSYSADPEKLVLDAEKMEEILKKIEERLSPFEKKVFRLYADGLSYADIGRRLGKEEKSINNALTRIKAKLRA